MSVLPRPAILECPKCQARVTATAEGAYEIPTDEESPGSTQFAFFRCAQCNGPFLLRRHGGPVSDDWGDGYHTDYEPWTMLHPGAPSLGPEVPDSIAKGYREAAACFTVGSNTATAIMCRRTIEAICVDKGATKRNLSDKLTELREKGLIAAQLVEWADQLRTVGNDAAHKVDQFILRNDAQDVLEFTRAIIEYVYVFTDAFNRFKERRTRTVGEPEVAMQ